MQFRARSVFAAAAVGTALLFFGVAPAWAPHVAQLQVTPAQAKAGDQVTVYGPRGYGRTNPVEVRWNSPSGPVLGSFAPNEESYAQFGPGQVTIPADAKPGTYQLFATQQLTPAESYIRGVPSRATIQVVGAGGPPAVQSAPTGAASQEPVLLQENGGVDGTELAVAAFGMLGLALFVAGGAAIVAHRRASRAPAPAAEKVQS